MPDGIKIVPRKDYVPRDIGPDASALPVDAVRSYVEEFGYTVPPPPPVGYPLPASPPRYSFVAGTYGDSLCGLGLHQHLMRSLGCESGAVLYYGPDATIADWLSYQPMVSEVIDVRSKGPVSGIPTDPARRHEWVPSLSEVTGIRATPSDIYPCHVDFTLRERLPVHRPELVTAPELAEWAKKKAWGDVGPPDNRSHYTLFQPRSETSCLWEGHWPCWHEAATYLGEQSTRLILCGKGDFGKSLFPGVDVSDFVNRTPSMPHLFALADLCDVIVTTSNALSLYAASKGLPTVVCCNTTHRRPEQFFTRFAKGPRSRIVEHWHDLSAFQKAWAEAVAL